MKNLLIILISILFLSSCEKKRWVDPYFAKTYPEILESIDLQCVKGVSDYYISATINGSPYCVYEDQVETGFWFDASTSFFTNSPNSGGTRSNIKRNPGLGFDNYALHRKPIFDISFPNFNVGTSKQEYLDSLTQIKDNDIIGKEDIVFPPGTPPGIKAIEESTGGFKTKFLVRLRILDRYLEDTANTFEISSTFGNQEGSYFRFNEVRKTEKPDGTYYYMDISFECNLYHWPQYGYEGLWGEVRDGRVIVNVKVEE